MGEWLADRQIAAAEAQRRGWPYRELDAGHFHMVVDPEAVAVELHALLPSLGLLPQGTAPTVPAADVRVTQ